MNLTTPTDHAGAYEWLVVLMAHGGVGTLLMAFMALALDWLSCARVERWRGCKT